MSTDLKSTLMAAVADVERSMTTAHHRTGYFANSLVHLYDKIKRGEKPNQADETAYMFACHVVAGNRIDVNLEFNSEAADPVPVSWPDENVVTFPRIARLPGAEI